jgi:SAM-dependent methyltransferase
MSYLNDILDIKGMDIDPDQVASSRSRGNDTSVGDGLMIPFEDDSFDLVLSSFYLMWVGDVKRAVSEMIRIARKRVLILSEPIWNMTIIEPKELMDIRDRSIAKISRDGGDPDSGITTLNTLTQLRCKFRYGTIPLDTTMDDVRISIDDEIAIHGEGTGVPEPILFHVPFIWACIDLSG